MSAATLMQLWGDTMLVTALLVLAVLLVRKPFARHFGPRLTYTLWLIPALRLVLPPLPFAEPVSVASAIPDAGAAVMLPVDAAAQPAAWSLTDAMPYLVLLWAVGMVVVLVMATLSHHRFRAAVLAEAVELEPIGSIRLVMTDAVDGPVAFGLWRRFVAVPHDFFARYVAEERALAVDHELAHHRHGDLWANAAALVLLASQWFNPFAWRAIRAFRFDQEAACDARVLTMADQSARGARTASYATAIAKAAVGSRLSLAAPMAVHDNLQERLTMLLQQDISKKRSLMGRLLIGGAAIAVLATTATLVPAGTARARAQIAHVPEPPAPPPPVDAPPAPDAVIFTSTGEDVTESVTTSDDGKRREVHRIVIRHDGEGDGAKTVTVAPADGTVPKVRQVEIRTLGSLSRDDVLATLKEQGIDGKQADAIADRLEAKRKERFRTALAPMPPRPPVPPKAPRPPAAWAPAQGHTLAVARCGSGQVAPMVDREEVTAGKRSRYVMIACADGPEAKAQRLSALKEARERFIESDRHLSEAMRAKVAADLDKAIAEMEKSNH
ncbi:M56 family metallopeptidase [Sphingopyxis sp. JAI128]|uniref:M56 family metallopeptidase n=1 Tax=Sphingopyxis sp. JAI128 TaxID=2723066 RepID=UPI00161DAB62|nr:M56 family metallopeptidase [Sphingopyxis sp. JAI128]MBB6427346.1 beta-lactamase regulating signal transducer with metallopeptidase domain [Sphingopyxis sp. JAI128]